MVLLWELTSYTSHLSGQQVSFSGPVQSSSRNKIFCQIFNSGDRGVHHLTIHRVFRLPECSLSSRLLRCHNFGRICAWISFAKSSIVYKKVSEITSAKSSAICRCVRFLAAPRQDKYWNRMEDSASRGTTGKRIGRGSAARTSVARLNYAPLNEKRCILSLPFPFIHRLIPPSSPSQGH